MTVNLCDSKLLKGISPNLLLIRKRPEVQKSRTLNPVSSEPPGPRAQPQEAQGTRVLANIESGSSHIRQVSSTPRCNVNSCSDRYRSKWVGARTGNHLVRKSED